ncbi:hypothetical protein AB1N83_008104 [Pleurotus pulmonarius]
MPSCECPYFLRGRRDATTILPHEPSSTGNIESRGRVVDETCVVEHLLGRISDDWRDPPKNHHPDTTLDSPTTSLILQIARDLASGFWHRSSCRTTVDLKWDDEGFPAAYTLLDIRSSQRQGNATVSSPLANADLSCWQYSQRRLLPPVLLRVQTASVLKGVYTSRPGSSSNRRWDIYCSFRPSPNIRSCESRLCTKRAHLSSTSADVPRYHDLLLVNKVSDRLDGLVLPLHFESDVADIVQWSSISKDWARYVPAEARVRTERAHPPSISDATIVSPTTASAVRLAFSALRLLRVHSMIAMM